MNRILKAGGLIVSGFLALSACDSSAPTNDSANAAATNQAAREAASEMHNQMTANDMADDRMGMQGMNDMHDMGNMQGGPMNNIQSAPMTNSMPMEDEPGDM